MTTALTRQPAPSLRDYEVTHGIRTIIHFQLAFQQHEWYCQTLKEIGMEVEVLPPQENFPDSVFIEDNAIILDELAIITPMGTASRQGEPTLLLSVLSRYRHLVNISLPAMIEGGDVIVIGKTLYVGISSRSNQAGIEALRMIGKTFGYQVVPIPIHGCLHLKTACTPLDDETLLVNPAWIDLEALKTFRLLKIPYDEPFGANVLRMPDCILANDLYPLTITLIEKQGYSVIGIQITEFSKAEAGLTCLSLIID